MIDDMIPARFLSPAVLRKVSKLRDMEREIEKEIQSGAYQSIEAYGQKFGVCERSVFDALRQIEREDLLMVLAKKPKKIQLSKRQRVRRLEAIHRNKAEWPEAAKEAYLSKGFYLWEWFSAQYGHLKTNQGLAKWVCDALKYETGQDHPIFKPHIYS